MTDLVGQTFGAYHIVSVIGHGGMATVYKAGQAAVDRLTAPLEHPHRLPIYDSGVTPDVGRAGRPARLASGRWAMAAAGDGLGGERMSALLARPDGSVWFATESRLARWLPER